MKSSFDVFGIDRARAAFEAAPLAVQEALERALDRAAGEVAAEMRQAAPKSSSLLANSIQVVNDGFLQRLVAPATEYADYVSRGRAPGKFPQMMPGSPFYEWVRLRVVGSSAARSKRGQARLHDLVWMIGRKIARDGIKPNPYIEDTAKRMESRVQELLRAGVEDGIRVVFG